jgi:hypothetical protein
MGASLLATLVTARAVLAVLYRISQTVKLHQRALVYEVHAIAHGVVTSLYPYSVGLSLVAVGINLWYGALEGTLKRL